MLTAFFNHVDCRIIFWRNPCGNSRLSIGFACYRTTTWP